MQDRIGQAWIGVEYIWVGFVKVQKGLEKFRKVQIGLDSFFYASVWVLKSFGQVWKGLDQGCSHYIIPIGLRHFISSQSAEFWIPAFFY